MTEHPEPHGVKKVPPHIVPVGVYRVRLTKAQLREEADREYGADGYNYDDVFALDDQEFVARMATVRLVELEVDDPGGAFELGEVWLSRPGVERANLQAPYDEVFLDLAGSNVVTLPQSRFRVAFFLHEYVGPELLHTKVGLLALPDCSEMPERLRSRSRYFPP